MSEGATVCVSMFDYLALAFHNKLDGYGKEPRIVIVTGINPKMVSGKSDCMWSLCGQLSLLWITLAYVYFVVFWQGSSI